MNFLKKFPSPLNSSIIFEIRYSCNSSENVMNFGFVHGTVYVAIRDVFQNSFETLYSFKSYKLVCFYLSEEIISAMKKSEIKMFRSVQKNFGTIGIGPNRAMQSHPFDAKILIHSMALSLGFIGTLMYTVIDAKTFLEFTQSIYVSSSIFFGAVIFVVLILNASELFELINDCECLISTSKLTNNNRATKFFFLKH